MKLYNQVAALPFKEGPECSICLITSRETGRWILPKGWAKAGIDNFEMAASEAREEAGLTGTCLIPQIGNYHYTKKLHTFASITCEVDVYAFLVTGELTDWREKNERNRRWFTKEEAATLVDEPELQLILKEFDFKHHSARAS
ncbi:MAG: NUDIX hydrolase [Rhodomicrobium sp.]|nr:MAG: NUDIX hydrolase [Rhodomicrobium sp.]